MTMTGKVLPTLDKYQDTSRYAYEYYETITVLFILYIYYATHAHVRKSIISLSVQISFCFSKLIQILYSGKSTVHFNKIFYHVYKCLCLH